MRSKNLPSILMTVLVIVSVPSAFAGIMDTVNQIVGKAGEAAAAVRDSAVELMPGKEPGPPQQAATPTPDLIPNGADMRRLQAALKGQGFDPNGVDGKLGPGTTKAIKAYQAAHRVNVDGLPTYALLVAVVQTASPPAAGRALTAASVNTQTIVKDCVGDSFSKDRSGLSDDVWNILQDELDDTQKSYLVGLCLPDGEQQLKEAYLYLVANGVTHARLTQEKLVQIAAVYERAGIDLAIRDDAFRNSAATLDADLNGLAKVKIEDRIAGIEKLLEHYNDQDAESRRLLKEFVAHSNSLRGQYKEDVRLLMSDALSHAASSNFFLARSLYTAKRLTGFLGMTNPVEGNDLNAMSRKIQSWFEDVTDNARLVHFLTIKRGEMTTMMEASTESVAMLSRDVDSIGRIELSMNKASTSLAARRESTGWALTEFEKGFEKEQLAAQRKA